MSNDLYSNGASQPTESINEQLPVSTGQELQNVSTANVHQKMNSSFSAKRIFTGATVILFILLALLQLYGYSMFEREVGGLKLQSQSIDETLNYTLLPGKETLDAVINSLQSIEKENTALSSDFDQIVSAQSKCHLIAKVA